MVPRTSTVCGQMFQCLLPHIHGTSGRTPVKIQMFEEKNVFEKKNILKHICLIKVSFARLENEIMSPCWH